jgi:hypothetical protein
MDAVTAALLQTISSLPPAEQFTAISAHHRRLDAGRLTLMLALQDLDRHLRTHGQDGAT